MENKIKFQPLGDRVVIEPDALENKTKGGLYLPVELQKEFRTGTIIAIGPDIYSKLISNSEMTSGIEKLTVRVGDKVMFESSVGTKITFEGDETEYILTRESYIAGIL